LKQCVGFWNKIVIRKDDDFVKKALVENVKMAVIDKIKQCWSRGFLRCMQRLGIIERFSDIFMDSHSLPKLDLGVIDKSIAEITAIKWQNLELMNPRSLGDDQGVGIKSVTYANWMRSLDDDSYTSYTKLLNNRKDITCIARLRLRAHNLNVDYMGSTNTAEPHSWIHHAIIWAVQTLLHHTHGYIMQSYGQYTHCCTTLMDT
jgi:hypothetical protein